MVKDTQTILRLLPTNCLSVFGHLVQLALKGLRIDEVMFRNLLSGTKNFSQDTICCKLSSCEITGLCLLTFPIIYKKNCMESTKKTISKFEAQRK